MPLKDNLKKLADDAARLNAAADKGVDPWVARALDSPWTAVLILAVFGAGVGVGALLWG